jgi:hypothetical protein
MMPVMDFRWGRVAYLASVILPIFEHVYGIPHEGICPLPRKERPKCGARNRQGKRCSVRVFCPSTAGTAAIICPRLDIVDAQCRERAPGPAGAALLTALIRDSGAGARGPEVP